MIIKYKKYDILLNPTTILLNPLVQPLCVVENAVQISGEWFIIHYLTPLVYFVYISCHLFLVSNKMYTEIRMTHMFKNLANPNIKHNSIQMLDESVNN